MKCTECKGTGWVNESSYDSMFSQSTHCWKCKGKGSVENKK